MGSDLAGEILLNRDQAAVIIPDNIVLREVDEIPVLVQHDTIPTGHSRIGTIILGIIERPIRCNQKEFHGEVLVSMFLKRHCNIGIGPPVIPQVDDIFPHPSPDNAHLWFIARESEVFLILLSDLCNGCHGLLKSGISLGCGCDMHRVGFPDVTTIEVATVPPRAFLGILVWIFRVRFISHILNDHVEGNGHGFLGSQCDVDLG